MADAEIVIQLKLDISNINVLMADDDILIQLKFVPNINIKMADAEIVI